MTHAALEMCNSRTRRVSSVVRVSGRSIGMMEEIVKISNAGLSLIKGFEGFRAKAYVCPAGVLTIGYGHTGPDVKPGMTISDARGTELLAQDVSRFERAVNKFVKVPLAQHQYDALVSFTYNVGEGNFQTSTLLKKLNAKDYAGAAAQFDRWNRGGGRVLAGLVRRRAAERKMFEGK